MNSNKQKYEVAMIGLWSSSETKSIVQNATKELYKYKQHSDVCKQFNEMYHCYGCALEQYNKGITYNVQSECKFFSLKN